MSQNRTLLASYINGVKTPRNFCLNPNAQFNKANITDTNNIVTRDTSTVLDGNASYLIDANSSGHFAAFLAAPFTKGTQGQNCEASFDYRGDASLYKAYVQLDSSIASAQQQLTNVTSGTQSLVLNFPCGVSDVAVPSLVIEATSASAAAFNMGNIYIGKATNVGDSAQNIWLGRKTMTPGSGCNFTKAAADWNDFSVQSGCGTPTFEGLASNSDKLPHITVPYRGAGTYRITLSTTIGMEESGSGNAVCQIRFNDGTTSSQTGTYYDLVSKGNQRSPNFIGEILKSSHNSSTITFKAQMYRNEGNMSCNIRALYEPMSLSVEYIPSASEQVFRIGAPGLEPTNFTPVLVGTGNGVAWTNIGTNTGYYTCQNRILTANYFTAFTGAPGGGTGAFLWRLPTGFTMDTTKIPSGHAVGVARLFDSGTANFPGVVVTNSSQGGGLTVTSENQGGDQGPTGKFTIANGDFLTFTVIIPVTADSPCSKTSMPQLKQAVTSNSEGVESVQRAVIRCSASSTIYSQSGTWITSVGNVSSGVCAVNIAPGTFSAAQTCVATQSNNSNGKVSSVASITASTTLVNIAIMNQIGGSTTQGTNEDVNIICMGPR